MQQVYIMEPILLSWVVLFSHLTYACAITLLQYIYSDFHNLLFINSDLLS